MSRSTASLSPPVSRRTTGTPTAQSTPSFQSSPLATSSSGSPLRRTHLPAVSQQHVQQKPANLSNSRHQASTSAATPPRQRPISAIQPARMAVQPTLLRKEAIAGKLMGRSVSSSPLGPVIGRNKSRSSQQLGADSQMCKTATSEGDTKNSEQKDTSSHSTNSVRANTGCTPQKASLVPTSPSRSPQPRLAASTPSDEHFQRPSRSSDFLKEEIQQTSTPRIVAHPLPTLSSLQNENKERVTSLPAQEPRSDKRDLKPKESSPPRITERITPEKVDGPAQAGKEEVPCREFMDSVVALGELELELPHLGSGTSRVRSRLEKWLAESTRDPTRFMFDNEDSEERKWKYGGYRYGVLVGDIDVLDRALQSLGNLWPSSLTDAHFQVLQLKFMRPLLIEGDEAKEIMEGLELTLLDRVSRGLRQIDKLATLLINGRCPGVPINSVGPLIYLKSRRDKYRQDPKTSRTVTPISPGNITSLSSSHSQGVSPPSPKSPLIEPPPSTGSDTYDHSPPTNFAQLTSVPPSTPLKSQQEDMDSVFFNSTKSSKERKRSQQPWTPITRVEPKNLLSVGQLVTSNLPCATSKNRDIEQPTISLPSTTWSPSSTSPVTSARQPPGILQMGATATAVSHSCGYKKPFATSSSGLEKVDNHKEREKRTLEHTVLSELGSQSNTKRNPLVQRIDLATGTESPLLISPTTPSKVLSHPSSLSPRFLRTSELHQLKSPTTLPPAITTCSSSTVPTSTSVSKPPEPLQIGKTAAEVPRSYRHHEAVKSPLGKTEEGGEPVKGSGDRLPYSMPTSKHPSTIAKDPKSSVKLGYRNSWTRSDPTATSQPPSIPPAPSLTSTSTSPMPPTGAFFRHHSSAPILPPSPVLHIAKPSPNFTPNSSSSVQTSIPHYSSTIALGLSQGPKFGTTPTRHTKPTGQLKTPLFSPPNHLGLPMIPSLEPPLPALTSQPSSWTLRRNRMTSVQPEASRLTTSIGTKYRRAEINLRKLEHWDINARDIPDFSPESHLYYWSTSPSVENRIYSFNKSLEGPSASTKCQSVRENKSHFNTCERLELEVLLPQWWARNRSHFGRQLRDSYITVISVNSVSLKGRLWTPILCNLLDPRSSASTRLLWISRLTYQFSPLQKSNPLSPTPSATKLRPKAGQLNPSPGTLKQLNKSHGSSQPSWPKLRFKCDELVESWIKASTTPLSPPPDLPKPSITPPGDSQSRYKFLTLVTRSSNLPTQKFFTLHCANPTTLSDRPSTSSYQPHNTSPHLGLVLPSRKMHQHRSDWKVGGLWYRYRVPGPLGRSRQPVYGVDSGCRYPALKGSVRGEERTSGWSGARADYKIEGLYQGVQVWSPGPYGRSRQSVNGGDKECCYLALSGSDRGENRISRWSRPIAELWKKSSKMEHSLVT